MELWVEKYRPQILEDYVGNGVIKNKIADYLKQGSIQNLLFHGVAGTGKTTLAKLISKNLNCDLLYLNASDERGIDTIREKIIPLLVSAKNSYFQSEDINLQEKKYDMFCSFGHTATGLRLETQNICQKLLNEGYNNTIGGNFKYTQYMDYIINSYIGISAWGAGNSCRRMWI